MDDGKIPDHGQQLVSISHRSRAYLPSRAEHWPAPGSFWAGGVLGQAAP
jgi:hypothetical protein